MSSFQQVMMGGICLVAAFWFGSQIHEHPAGLQQPLQGLSNATAGVLDGQVNGQQVQSQLAAKTKGFFNSLFEAPAKPQPVTLSDLKSRATSGFANATSQNPGGSFVPNQGFGLPKQVVETATEVVSDFAKPPFPNLGNDRSFVADNQIADRNYSAENNHVDQQRLEIVPNFSTLVEDVRRTRAEQSRPIEHFVEAADTSGQHNSMLPVPKMDEFSRTSFGQATFEQPARDWNVVKQGVTSVEAKLKQFRSAHPVAEEFKPVQAFDSTALTATNKTSGRFIPEATSAQPKFERRETREQWSERTNQTFVPDNTSMENYKRYVEGLVPQNELRSDQFRDERRLRTENQYAGQTQARQQVFEPAVDAAQFIEPPLEQPRYRDSNQSSFRRSPPAPSESLTQRQDRWKVFGDRKGAAGNAFDTRPSPPESLDYSVTQPRRAAEMRSAPERFVPERSVPERSVSERSIPEESRVRSLNDMPLQTQDRWSEPVARQRRVAPERQERQPPQRLVEQTASRPLANDAGPEVIRYSNFETYVTEDGDTLQTISESFFGTPEYYFDLYLANRNVLINPATVSPGTKLRIPNLTQ